MSRSLRPAAEHAHAFSDCLSRRGGPRLIVRSSSRCSLRSRLFFQSVGAASRPACGRALPHSLRAHPPRLPYAVSWAFGRGCLCLRPASVSRPRSSGLVPRPAGPPSPSGCCRNPSGWPPFVGSVHPAGASPDGLRCFASLARQKAGLCQLRPPPCRSAPSSSAALRQGLRVTEAGAAPAWRSPPTPSDRVARERPVGRAVYRRRRRKLRPQPCLTSFARFARG